MIHKIELLAMSSSSDEDDDRLNRETQSPRPRANSAPVQTLHGITRPTLNLNGNDTLSRALAGHRLKTGMGTNKNNSKGGRIGRSLSRDRQRHVSMQSRREDLDMRCCRISVLLVTMQLCLGAAVTSLGFYMQTLSESLLVRECPFWAGVPVSELYSLYSELQKFTIHTK